MRNTNLKMLWSVDASPSEAKASYMGLLNAAKENIKSLLRNDCFKRDATNFERVIQQINKTGDEGTRICFLDLFASHYQFSKHTIEELALTHPVNLLVFNKEHPAYQERCSLKNVSVFLIDDRWRHFVLQWIRIPYLVTPASHLHPSAVRPDLKIVHSYHSLVSMTTVYGDDAFDAYTHFFACGPHHVQEVKAINEARGLPQAKVFEVGYPKLDELACIYRSNARRDSNRKTVLLAPSWHPTNLLKLHAETICKAVLSLNYNLIVRPHPHLYERETETMNVLRRIEAAAKGQMQIEDPHKQFDSFWSADLMISDWSGVALEYAFATEQPVIFIDAPRKAASVDLLSLNLPTVEDTLRSKVGVIVKSVGDLDAGVQKVFATPAGEWRDRIRSVRDQYIFNFESSAKEGARILSALADDAEMLPPTMNTKKRLVELIRAYS